MDKALENLEKVDTIDVDEAVTTTAPLYKQYVDHMHILYKFVRLIAVL